MLQFFFTSNVQCFRLAAGRRTLEMCCYTEVIRFSIVAYCYSVLAGEFERWKMTVTAAESIAKCDV